MKATRWTDTTLPGSSSTSSSSRAHSSHTAAAAALAAVPRVAAAAAPVPIFVEEAFREPVSAMLQLLCYIL
jgi:hypothetical protein